MPTWPNNLPARPLNDGFQEVMADTLLRTTMDQGPAKLRRRGTAGVGALSLQYILSAAEVAALKTFYHDTLGGGALAFIFTHPVTLASLTCRFKSPPSFSNLNGGYFRVRVELEVLP